MDELMTSVAHWATRLLELAGIGIILVGAVAAAAIYLGQLLRARGGEERIDDFRSNLGRSILLGLEFLVAADIVNTVAIDPTLDSLAVLGGIVLVRTFLSFALEVELEGHWPWQRHKVQRAKSGAGGTRD